MRVKVRSQPRPLPSQFRLQRLPAVSGLSPQRVDAEVSVSALSSVYSHVIITFFPAAVTSSYRVLFKNEELTATSKPFVISARRERVWDLAPLFSLTRGHPNDARAP